MLTTDTGGPSGQKVTATSGDLRYCVNQADAPHAAGTDTISFSATVFAKPQTITLDSMSGTLVLQDKNSLRLQGLAKNTVTVSGGDQVGVFDIPSGKVAIGHLAIDHGNTGGDGGGISNSGVLTLTHCTLDHDEAAGNGGGVLNNARATLTNCILSNDSAAGSNGGGGIVNSGTLTLTRCTLDHDSAVGGGGLCNNTTATLTNCTLSNDSATNNDGSSGGGGVINGGTLTLTNCTLDHDSAVGGGGGIFNNTSATLTNCTFSNDVAAGGDGGGIINGGPLMLTNCTLSNNAAAGNGGGISNDPGRVLNLINTIVAGNTATGSGPDIFGAVHTADHDLIGDAGGSTGIANGGGNLVGGNGSPVLDPRLGPLQNNGGPTQTMALLSGSPAKGHGDNAFAPHTDQRGFLRLDEAGEITDIGAFEA